MASSVGDYGFDLERGAISLRTWLLTNAATREHNGVVSNVHPHEGSYPQRRCKVCGVETALHLVETAKSERASVIQVEQMMLDAFQFRSSVSPALKAFRIAPKPSEVVEEVGLPFPSTRRLSETLREIESHAEALIGAFEGLEPDLKAWLWDRFGSLAPPLPGKKRSDDLLVDVNAALHRAGFEPGEIAQLVADSQGPRGAAQRVAQRVKDRRVLSARHAGK